MKLRLIRVTIPAIIAGFSMPTLAGEIGERMRAPAAFVFTTVKQPGSLEYCIADAISSLGPVAALSDGPNRVIVTASAPSGRVLVAVELNGTKAPTQVTGHVYGPRWNDRMRDDVANCI